MSAFDLGMVQEPVVAVSGGLSHAVWRLRTDSGSYAVKALRNIWGNADFLPRLEQACRFEHDVWRTGVNMPEPILHSETGNAVTTAGRDVWVRVHRWVGAEPVPAGAVSVHTAEQVGQALAAIHALGRTVADPATCIPWHVPHADWQGLAREYPPLHTALPAIGAALQFLRDNGPPSGMPVFTHGDIDQKNLLLAPDGAVSIVDWDVCATMPAECELLRAAFDLGGWQTTSPDWAVVRGLIRGYRAAGGLAGTLRLHHLAMALMLHLDWVAFNVGRALGGHAPDQQDLGRRTAPVTISQLTCMWTALATAVAAMPGGVHDDFEGDFLLRRHPGSDSPPEAPW